MSATDTRIVGGPLIRGRSGKKKCAHARLRVTNRRRRERRGRRSWLAGKPILNDGVGGNTGSPIGSRGKTVYYSYVNAIGGQKVPTDWCGRGKSSLPEGMRLDKKDPLVAFKSWTAVRVARGGSGITHVPAR